MTTKALQDAYKTLMASDVYTSYLVKCVMQCYTSDNGYPMWRDVAGDLESARSYYQSIDEDERRSKACIVLASHGYTRSCIWRVFS